MIDSDFQKRHDLANIYHSSSSSPPSPPPTDPSSPPPPPPDLTISSIQSGTGTSAIRQSGINFSNSSVS